MLARPVAMPGVSGLCRSQSHWRVWQLLQSSAAAEGQWHGSGQPAWPGKWGATRPQVGGRAGDQLSTATEGKAGLSWTSSTAELKPFDLPVQQMHFTHSAAWHECALLVGSSTAPRWHASGLSGRSNTSDTPELAEVIPFNRLSFPPHIYCDEKCLVQN